MSFRICAFVYVYVKICLQKSKLTKNPCRTHLCYSGKIPLNYQLLHSLLHPHLPEKKDFTISNIHSDLIPGGWFSTLQMRKLAPTQVRPVGWSLTFRFPLCRCLWTLADSIDSSSNATLPSLPPSPQYLKQALAQTKLCVEWLPSPPQCTEYQHFTLLNAYACHILQFC